MKPVKTKSNPHASAYPVHGAFAADNAIRNLMNGMPDKQATYADMRCTIICSPDSLRRAVRRMLANKEIKRLDWGVYGFENDCS